VAVKAKSLQVGDPLVSNGRVYVVVSVEPDEDVMTINVSELKPTERMFLHPREKAPQPKLMVDPDQISAYFATRLYDKIASAQLAYGAEWTGACGSPIDCLEEEILDALAYIWVHRQIIAMALQSLPEVHDEPQE
jgi:hypothetical protein